MDDEIMDLDKMKEKLENDLDEVIDKKKDIINKLITLESEENLLYSNLKYFQNFLNIHENNNYCQNRTKIKNECQLNKESYLLNSNKMNEIYEQNNYSKEDTYSIHFIKNNFKKD